MTNHWIDLQNCKTILVEGSNVAENHPMAFKWIRKAQENGAKIIHVDPRFTRTSAAADVYARIRPGTDAAFQNTMINYILVNKLYDEDYVTTHTNALFLGDQAFDFKDGVFSGFDEENHKYHTETWGYQLDAKGKPRVAKSLDDPHCVFSRLKTFVSRYTLETGERITGIPADQIRQIAEMMAKNRPGSILYALGMTQHTTGVQGIRSFTILQLLLGNIGKPGGGVNALRGEPNVQGACDMAVLYNYMPGYLNSASNAEPTIHDYVRKNGIADSRYLVNTLKAFFGEAATAENDYAYAWLPKRNASKDYGTLPMFEDALAGKLKLLWIVGQNPAVTVPNLKLTFDAMAKLETLVVQEIWETETAAFWRRPGVDPKSISTEVILLPAAFFMEKNGTISNSGGMVQWRHAAVKPPGQAKSDGEIVDLVFRAVRDLVKDSKEPRDEIIRKAFWTYTTAEDVLREINGYALRDNPETGLKAGDLVRKVSDLRADGSTSSGAWIYAGVFANGENLSKRRDSQTDPGGLGLYPGFGWTWPNNMRILYNRASCDRHGKPYPGSKPIVWWDEKAKRWTGYDVPDVPVATDGPEYAEWPASIPLGRGRRRAPLRGRLLGPGREASGVSARRGLRAEGRPAAGDVRACRESGGERPAPEGEPQPDAQVSARQVLPADRHGRGVSLRAHDIHRRGTLVRGFLDAQYSVVERTRSRAHARNAGKPCAKAIAENGRLGESVFGPRRTYGESRGHTQNEDAPGRRTGSHCRVDAIQLGLSRGFRQARA